jgi:hypothetical protein
MQNGGAGADAGGGAGLERVLDVACRYLGPDG